MALTITRPNDSFFNMGSLNGQIINVAFDASYPTGGESFTPADVGMSQFFQVVISNTKGVAFEYDYTNKKIKAFVQGFTHGAAGAATPDDFILTGVASNTAYSMSLAGPAGAGTAYLGVMPEVSNSADLSTITGVRVAIIGV